MAPGRHEEDSAGDAVTEPGSMVIRPGEGGYIEALAEWESEQHPDRGEAVSTASGREQAMAVVHAVAEDPDHVAEAVDALDDPVGPAAEPSGADSSVPLRARGRRVDEGIVAAAA